MQKIGLKRDLRCINPCKSGDGSYLKKLTSPPKGGGVEVGILGGQKIKSPGNVMNCPENQYNLFLPIPPGGGVPGGGGLGGGQNFKSPVNFMNCRENR